MKNASLALRKALGQFATGITVVTTLDESGQPLGLTVNSFASVSLEPPLVLWSLARSVSSASAFAACRGFVVNVLAADQKAVSERFAAKGIDKFAGTAWTPGPGGVPVIAGCCARFECSRSTVHDGGDHLILVGHVDHFELDGRAPLLFHGGAYHALGERLA